MAESARGHTASGGNGQRHATTPTFHHSEFDVEDLLAAKEGKVAAKERTTIAVCLPARDEASTIGRIVSVVCGELTAAGGGVDLVDEVLVVDDSSTDATAEEAARSGARVVTSSSRQETGPLWGTGSQTMTGPGRSGAPAAAGKGEAMTVAIAQTHSDIVVFVDADVENFGPHFVTGLVGPLLLDEDLCLVKGFYRRPLGDEPHGGGRVTELVARPVIDLLFPHLSGVAQPLAGEIAAPRAVLEKVDLASGYGVELGLLVDVARSFGTQSIAQVDLGSRVHRNRPLSELRGTATDVMRTALQRAGIDIH